MGEDEDVGEMEAYDVVNAVVVVVVIDDCRRSTCAADDATSSSTFWEGESSPWMDDSRSFLPFLLPLPLPPPLPLLLLPLRPSASWFSLARPP